MLGVIMIGSTTQVHADMGPKPTAHVTITGHDEPYMFDVLVKKSTPVDTLDDESLERNTVEYYDPEAYPEVLNGYQDGDGYASMTLYDNVPRYITREHNTFELGYFGAPREFKIVLVFDEDTIITSPSIERQQFNALITYDVSDVDKSESQENVGVIEEEIPYAEMATDFFIRLVATIAIELGVLALFFYRKLKSFILAGGVNLATQSLLTLFMVMGYYYWGNLLAAFLILILGETLVIIAEMIIYGLYLKEHSWLRAILYALTANGLSMAAGFTLLLI